MARLTATTPFAGQLPIAAGPQRLVEIDIGPITWVAPFRGRRAEVSAALEAQVGAAFPAPGRVTGGTAEGAARAVWFGPEQALVLGAAVTGIAGAALVDQTSGWAACALEGPDAVDVLARLVPIDLRGDRFAEGQAARTLLGHMSCLILRAGPARFEILVFRSMAATCAHDIGRALRMVAARTVS